ncbi:putative inactive purple acid phosphatase 27 [Forsythia ovata]|uniref:Purple acid phosphatase n=1 Tax=Forsythia ovata TaxID=205694 RepID=A0ABD1W275_9LAMI
MKNTHFLLRVVLILSVLVGFNFAAASAHANRLIGGEQPLSKIAIHKVTLALRDSATIKASPIVLGIKGKDTEWVNVDFEYEDPSDDDWIGVFSPAKFNGSNCYMENDRKEQAPYICTSPIKYQFANFSNSNYRKTGKASVKFQLINQRADFSFALFAGGLSNPKLVAISNSISFANPKAPVYPRLAQGKSWDEMTVTWTSGYNIHEAIPFVQWGLMGQHKKRSPGGTLTFNRNSMCGSPARTVGWRDPGFIHTSFLKDLWPNSVYTYMMGHLLSNGSYVWSKKYSFRSSPYPGQNSLQRVIIFGDMGKAERDGSNEYSNYQPGSLNTTDQLIKDLTNIDIIFHIGDITYCKWLHLTMGPIYGTGSFYDTMDSGGECGVLAETMFYVPAENRAKFWYSTDYADRKKQPWLIFAAHRVLGYSSDKYYGLEGSFEEPMGRESLQRLWQKYKVDIAFYGHVHNYERSCPIYQNKCVNSETSHYSGIVNGTIHVVVGGGGAHLSEFSSVNTSWSLYKDHDWGFVKLTAFNQSSLLFEYVKSSDGKVYDSFTISRDYKDVLACVHDGCEATTLAT